MAIPLLAPASEGSHDELTISSSSNRREVEIRFKGKRILLYAFATNQFKPYVKELYSLSGENILRDAPDDHLHHHGLMYAIRVNGVNFWEETGEPGRQRSMRITLHKTTSDSAAFTEVIEWTANNSNIPLLYETRTISVSVPPGDNEVALDWRSVFQVGAAKVRLSGSAYNGLGLRLPESFDHVAVHQNSEGLPYTADAKWDVTPAHWSAVTGTINKTETMIALFETSSNGGETRFFTMLNPFAYLSVTQNLEQQPLEYKPGQRFEIRYLLTIYSESKSRAFLDARHQQWLCAFK